MPIHFECPDRMATNNETETKACGQCGTMTDYMVCANECGTFECEDCANTETHLCKECDHDVPTFAVKVPDIPEHGFEAVDVDGQKWTYDGHDDEWTQKLHPDNQQTYWVMKDNGGWVKVEDGKVIKGNCCNQFDLCDDCDGDRQMFLVNLRREVREENLRKFADEVNTAV